MSTDVVADQVLDCTGLLCPIPVIKTSRAIKTIEVGQVLKLIATDLGSPPDMKAWARQTGNPMIHEETADGTFSFWFRRTS